VFDFGKIHGKGAVCVREGAGSGGEMT
jgi:hypothetical protein